VFFQTKNSEKMMTAVLLKRKMNESPFSFDRIMILPAGSAKPLG